MVQKSDPPKKRGRPPAYDRDVALRRALHAFWQSGFAATSLDDLSAATGMNRPSLYGAFGDKQEIYLQALESYRAASRAGIAEALAFDRPLADGLRRVFDGAISIYVSDKVGGRGCFLIGTAAAEAVQNPAVRAALAAGVREVDEAFEVRLRHAREQGELPADADPSALASLASAVIHTMAIRARAGESRSALEAIGETAIEAICGRTSGKRRSRRARSTGTSRRER